MLQVSSAYRSSILFSNHAWFVCEPPDMKIGQEIKINLDPRIPLLITSITFDPGVRASRIRWDKGELIKLRHQCDPPARSKRSLSTNHHHHQVICIKFVNTMVIM